MEKHWFSTYWITLLICSRFPVESALWNFQSGDNYKPTSIQLKSLLKTPNHNNLMALPQNFGTNSAEVDNPNKIQKLMAQEFIKSVSNLFSAYEENSGDNKLFSDSYLKPIHDIKARMKQLAAIGFIPHSKITSEEDLPKENRKKRSYNTFSNSDSVHKVYKCHRVGPLALECSKDIGMIVPHRKFYKSSEELPIHDLYHKLQKKQCLLENYICTFNSDTVPLHFRKRWDGPYTEVESNNINERGSEPLRNISHFISDKNQEPPVELTMSQDKSSRHSSKWVKRQAYCGRLDPIREHYDMTPGTSAEVQSCRRCSPQPALEDSVNVGKQAKILFPVSHRCIRRAKVAVSQGTTYPPEQCFSKDVLTGTRRGLDLVDCDSTAQSFNVSAAQMKNNTGEETDPSSGAQRNAERSICHAHGRQRSYPQEHAKIHFRKRRACGCRCGCSCRKSGPHPEQHAAVGQTACGCSCGCGCIHLPGSPDCSPHQLRSKERLPVS